MRDELKRLRATEMAVLDDPTAKVAGKPPAKGGVSRPHKPLLDEMGIALYHEVKPARSGATAGLPAEARSAKAGPRKPTLDEMGPGVEAIPARKQGSPDEAQSAKSGPRSTMGKPGMRGGFKPRRR
jgi:excinuclease ABC subunit B